MHKLCLMPWQNTARGTLIGPACSLTPLSVHSFKYTVRCAGQAQRELHGPPSFTLEASVGAASQLELELLATGAFGAEVHPSLPIATTWQGLYKQLMNRLQGTSKERSLSAATAATATAARPKDVRVADAALMADIAATEAACELQGIQHVLHVATVGAQLNSMEDIHETMCAAAGVLCSGELLPPSKHRPAADALLLVSGSHPVRQLPLLQQFLPSSVPMLKHAVHLKRSGVLPPHLALWAVANPVVEQDASYTECKVAAGAEVILTQPPLDWPAFERWMEDAQRRQLHTAARLLVGFPLLSGAGNVAFWAALCGAGSNEQVKSLQQQFLAAEGAAQKQQVEIGSGSSQAPSAFAQEWNSQLLSRLQTMPGVSGLHVMPITTTSKRLALQMAKAGAFNSSAWPSAGSSGCTNS